MKGIALAVSGDTDGLSLLKLLAHRRSSVGEDHELVALHVQSGIQCNADISRAELERLFREQRVEYSFERVAINDHQWEPGRQPGCFWCSWNRRKALFTAAHRLRCNKLALAHHADDVAQTTLLNLVYHGRLETMEPKVSFFDGEITLTRPRVYVPEKELVRFAKACGFPVEGSPCPSGLDSKRNKMRDLLRELEKESPRVKANVLRAVQSYGSPDST